MPLNQIIQRENRFFRSLLLLWLCFLSSGCQTTIQSNIRTDYDFDSNKDTGLIVGTVSHPEATDNMAFSHFFINHYSGQPKAMFSFRERDIFYAGHPAEFEFEDAENKGILFVLELPAGEYKVDNWQIHYAYIVLYPKSAPTPLEFKIQPNEVMYLGNFHMHIPQKKVLGLNVDDGGFPVIKDKKDRDITLFRKLYPNLSSRNIKLNVLHEGLWTNELSEFNELTIPKSD